MRTRKPRNRRWPRVLVIALALPAVLLTVNALVTSLLVRREARVAPRDPETGIMIGAEPRDLGPVNAPGAVLFIHGFVGGSNNFADLPDQVAAAGWRVRCLRLPGHGTSPQGFANTTPDELIAAVRKETATLRAQYDKVVLVGHSMGGALATLAASEIPVDGLVLAAPYFGVTCHWYYGLRPETWSRLASPLVPWLYKGKLFLQLNRKEAKPEVFSYTWIPARGVLTLIEIGRRANAPEVPGAIECPVLWLHGADDRAAAIDAARSAFDAMPSKHKRAVELPRSNHHLFWDYDRDQVFSEILHFLKANQKTASHRVRFSAPSSPSSLRAQERRMLSRHSTDGALKRTLRCPLAQEWVA